MTHDTPEQEEGVTEFAYHRDRATVARMRQSGYTDEEILLRAIFMPPLMSMEQYLKALREADEAGEDSDTYIRKHYPNQCVGWDER
ncbi:MAG: hypothetical protein ACYCRH_08210 [Acidiferrobacteraceae bacterium]